MKRRLTKEEISFLLKSQKILKSNGVQLTDKDINEGLLGTFGSFVAGGLPGVALYWWLNDDAVDKMDDIKDKMEDVLDSSQDLLDSMKDLFGEIENSDVKVSMEKSGTKAYDAIKAVMGTQFEAISAEMKAISEKAKAKKEDKEITGKETGEEEEKKEKAAGETAEELGGSEPLALTVMSAAVARVLVEVFKK